jgi:hypothetical protein
MYVALQFVSLDTETWSKAAPVPAFPWDSLKNFTGTCRNRVGME